LLTAFKNVMLTVFQCKDVKS